MSQFSCGIPAEGGHDRVVLAHGEGGRLMRTLIERTIAPRFTGDLSRRLGDAAHVLPPPGTLAITTDSFVVAPLFFPGGDIGKLAVLGTANDLAVSGARPHWITLSLILEEGLPLELLARVLDSASRAADSVGAQVIAGDTKVVPRGAADQIFINTTGIGFCWPQPPAGPASLAEGDRLIVTGPIGQHGAAVMAAREGLEFDPPPDSDCASLLPAVAALLDAGIPVRAMRDATRGGVAAVMHEWAENSGCTLSLDENALPLSAAVRALGEVLGIDPLHMACEGTMVVAVPAEAADDACRRLRSVDVSAQAVPVGDVRRRGIMPVVVRRALGRDVPLDEPLGAPLPRIC